MLDRFYFQYLDIEFDTNEICQLLKRFPLTESKFSKEDLKEIKILMPTLFAWFEQQNMVPVLAIIINHSPGFKQDIHADNIAKNTSSIAVNIPLNNLAKDSITRMYNLVTDTIGQAASRDIALPYFKFENEDVVKHTEYTSHKPVLVNITKPHSAWNNTDYNRGVLTIRFETNPTHLIKELT
jgi:hypothetical protein